MRNIRLLLQYEGTRYQGWQRQESSSNTIQAKLEQLLSKMCGEPIELQSSGRTDSGVHAKGQVANFHTDCQLTPEEVLAYCNRYLPEDIAVVEVREVSPRFHSRLHATGKAYRYQILNSRIPDVFLRRYAQEIEEELDVAAMRRAAEFLTGEHDFRSFTSSKKGNKPTVRRLDEIRIEKKGALITIFFRGNGFLYHMARILAGTLVEVGMKKRAPESMEEVLKAGDREQAGRLLPAKGLTLVEVYY
jgi:tRNA pseudouridine38-40 synthase